MFLRLNLLLLFCFVSHGGTPRSDLKSVAGKKGGSVKLECKLENNEVINLIRRSKSILDCQNKECESKTENVQGICKEGACEIYINNLSFSDAGKYILRFTNYLTAKEQSNRMYQLHIEDGISVKIGEELKLDILSNAEVVEHQDMTSKEWMKVWSRNKRLQSDRMNETDGNLTIIAFTSNDTGIYRALDSDRQLLITVTVSSTELKGELENTYMDKTHKQIPVWVWILIGVFLVALIALVVIKKRKCLTMNGNNEQDYTNGVQMQEIVQEPRTQNNSNGAFRDNRSAEDSVSISFQTESAH